MVSIPRALGSSSSNSGYILCTYDINGGRMLCAPLLDRKETGWYFTKGGKVSFRTMRSESGLFSLFNLSEAFMISHQCI